MFFYDYFKLYKDYFWQWEDNAEVLAIPNGNTIAYNALIEEVLLHLKDQGIPPFGALLLAIIATNPNGKKALDSIENTFLFNNELTFFKETISFLKTLSEIPKEYKTGKKRLLLFHALFENCHYISSIKNSRNTADSYRTKQYSIAKLLKNNELPKSGYSKDFRCIALLKKKFPDVTAIIEKIAAIPEINEEIDIPNVDKSEQNDTESLITELIDNSKTFHVGALVKRIWSGLHIKLHSVLPSEQPIGGVSDITNKGDFDRLLLSEYANEDIVFLSRLSNNEALYFQRETPPSDDNHERVILIDTSLKNWGTPKTIAFATMLAIAKHPKSKIDCNVYAIGDNCYPIIIDSVSTIIDGLQLLEGSLDASKGLAEYFEKHSVTSNTEVFVITSQTAIKQQSMLKVISEYEKEINYWIYTDVEGNIDIYRKQRSSKKHLQHLKIPLEELWKKKAIKTTEPNLSSLPASCPILSRGGTNVKEVLFTKEGDVFQVTSDKVLLMSYIKDVRFEKRGWEIIYENLLFTSGEFQIGLLDNGEYLFLAFDIQKKEANLVNLNTKKITTKVFDFWRSTSHIGFVFKDQKFHHFNQKGTWSISFDGVIERSDLSKDEFFYDDEVQLKKRREIYGVGTSIILKNIKEVFINENNRLVFNIHELGINSGGHLKLDSSSSLVNKISGIKSKEGDSSFVFNDGSRIIIKRFGIIVLQSSNKEIPNIYIPSVVKGALAAATEIVFAGNEYYYKESVFKVSLDKLGSNKLAVVKLIEEFSDYGLKKAKEFVDEIPSVFLGAYTKSEAGILIVKLEEIGCELTLEELSNPSAAIEKKEISEFYHQYINAFIENILTYGTEN